MAAIIAAFGLFLWLSGFAPDAWLPHDEADQWVVRAAFAGVVAAGVGTATAWWAGRDGGPAGGPPPQLTPQERGTGDRIDLAGGDHIEQIDNKGPTLGKGKQKNIFGRDSGSS
ncbi:hypothetical protein ACFVY0_33855 [Streptomyces sp. NPDC058286]|uniref:hypothetical protein n=1 Tax=Streptomyces sp. NPDC058286 TaxID=3346422 RepID=UPI0036EBD1A9